MNGSGISADILNVLFYLFIMLLIAFVVSKKFRKCLLRTVLPLSWAKYIEQLFSKYIFACETTEAPPVVKKENFSNDDKKIVFYSYTADWCPHCVTFKNESLGKLQNYFRNNKNIEVINVDCTNDQGGNIKTKGGKSLNGYPTLVVNTYSNNKMSEELYEGSRDAKSIIQFLENL